MNQNGQDRVNLALRAMDEAQGLLDRSRAVSAYYDSCHFAHLTGADMEPLLALIHGQAVQLGVSPYALIGIATLAQQQAEAREVAA